MADEDLGTGSVTVELDDTAAEASLDRLAERIERSLDRAARNAGARMERQLNRAIRRISPAEIEVTADTARLEAALSRFNNLGTAPLSVTPDVDRAAFESAVASALSGIEVSVRITPDFDGFDAAVRAHSAPPVDVRVRPDVDGRGLSRAIGGIGKALGSLGGIAKTTLAIGALGIAAASAATSVGGLVAALAPAAGIIAAGPAVILGYQAALGGLKLALTGVADAFESALTGDAKEFDKAIKDLSPAAKAAAQEVRALKPAFDKLKNTVQDAFFKNLTGQITRTANALRGPLTSGLAAIADAWGGAAKNALGYVQGTKGVGNIRDILTASTQAVEGLAQGTNKLTAGFLQAGAVVAKQFGPELAGGISAITQRFGTFLQTAAGDGRLVAWVDDALDVLAQLGDLLGNIGGIISGVFKAADASGGGFLANLQTITQTFETFVKSAEGQQAISNIFTALAAVAAQLGPIIAALVKAFAGIAPALAPLFTAIGPAITNLINAIGPAVQALLPGVTAVVNGIVAALNEISASGALADIGKAFGEVLKAIAPILPVIGQLVAAFGQALAPVISAVALALAPVIKAIASALIPILPPLVDVVLQLVDAFTPLLAIIGTSLAAVIKALAPLLLTLATTLGTIAEAVAPLIVQLAEGFAPILEQIAPVLDELVAAIAPLIVQFVNALLPVLPQMVDSFLALLAALTPLIEPITQLIIALTPFIALVISSLAPVIQLTAEILKWLSLSVVVPIIELIVEALGNMIDAVTSVITSVTNFVTAIRDKFTAMKETVSRLVANISEDVKRKFTELKDAAVARTIQLVASIRDKFTELKSAVVQKTVELVGEVVRFFQELPGRIVSALSGLANILFSVGADMIRGLISGVKSRAGEVASAAIDVVGGAVAAAKNFLDIKSPSKVFIQIGKFIGQGLVVGLTGSQASVRQASTKLVQQITNAFKGQKTTKDDFLVALVRRTQGQLESLAKQRENLAARIQAANELAAKTTQSALQSFQLGNINFSGSIAGRNGLIDSVGKAASRINRFNSQITALAKRGLRRDLLSQLIGLGPDQGAQLASQLAASTNAELKQLNDAQARLDAAAKRFGKNSADVLFDAGTQAAKGFLSGLKAQQKQIEALMVSIAKGLTLAIRRALGIKSPSTVLKGIGVDTGRGLVNGLAAMQAAVARTATSLAQAAVQPFRVATPVSVAARPVSSLVDPFGRQAATQPSGAAVAPLGTRTGNSEEVNITNNFVINEVGNAEATAHRVLNRLALVASL